MAATCTTVAQSGSTATYTVSLTSANNGTDDTEDGAPAFNVNITAAGTSVLSESVVEALTTDAVLQTGSQFEGQGFNLVLLPSSGTTSTTGTLAVTSNGLNIDAPVSCNVPAGIL